ncbi:hypothetical protein R1sor_018458 [Riccia sorocarpa]|uniref:Uncharacterized protein n=1 Tax=Riccia sorocarpa TaxID=122646 RepID=A0ABD3IDU3_9MARC
MAELGKDAKARAVQEITNWCEDKGTIVFLPHLLNLLDIEYLRTWSGLKHVKFPTDCTEDNIPNKHWRYRFYHGITVVLGWSERVTHGDSRYFGEDLHRAIKQLWPDEGVGETAKERTSRKRQSLFNHPFHVPHSSPVKLRVLHSPSGSGQIHAGFSLRRNKRAARQPATIPVQSPAESPVLNSPTSLEACVELAEESYRLVDEGNLPILRPPAGLGRVGHSYVTKSLFRDSVSHTSEGSQSTVIPPAEIKTQPHINLVGVSMDVLTPEELAGCIMCDREFLCSELVEEFVDDVANLQKVKVRLMHSGKVIETFRNCCEFTEKYFSCAVHSQSMENTVSGICSSGFCYESSGGVGECINSAVFSDDNDSDSDWEEDCPGEEVSSGSESSDCETYVEQVIQEDLPRLGASEVGREKR